MLKKIIHPKLSRTELIIAKNYFFGYSGREVAEIIGISFQRVYANLMNVRKKYEKENGVMFDCKQIREILILRDKDGLLFDDEEMLEDDDYD